MCSIKKRHSLKLKKSGNSLPWVLVIASAVILGINFKTLAHKVPIFFNWPSKDSQGMATKDVLWAVPILFSLVLYILSVIIKKLKESNTNLYHSNSVYVTQSLQMLKSLKLLFGFVCLFLVCASLNNSSEIHKAKYVISYQLAPFLCIAIPFYYLIKGFVLSRREGK